jgi:predicted transcriptional regulator
MSPGEFKLALDKLGLSQSSCARLVGVDPRMVRYYAKGEYPVSQMLALLLRVMARKKISPDVVAALLPLK